MGLRDLNRLTLGTGMLDPLRVVMPAARSARSIPERPLDGLGITRLPIGYGDQLVLPVRRRGRSAGPHGHGKLRVHLLPLIQAVRVDA